MNKFRLQLENLDLRIAPDATPVNMPPPPGSVIPIQSPTPGLDLQTVSASLIAQFKAAIAVVDKDVADVNAQALIYANVCTKVNDAQDALRVATPAQQPALLIKFNLLVKQQEIELQKLKDAVYQYRADLAALMRLGLSIRNIVPSIRDLTWDTLDPNINNFVANPDA